jgi:F-type H+-transporting ATPase subunit b
MRGETMTFNIISFIWHVVNGLILYFALRHFLYKPVRRFMDERAQRIQNQLDEAQQAQQAAQAELDKQRALTEKAQEQITIAAQDGAEKGRQRAQEIIQQAKQQADRIIEEAQAAAESRRQAEREAQHQRTVELGTALASRLLDRELTAQDDSKLIDDFLNKVG